MGIVGLTAEQVEREMLNLLQLRDEKVNCMQLYLCIEIIQLLTEYC